MLNVVLLSGAVQYFNIYALAAVNMLFQCLFLMRAGFRVSKAIAVPGLIIYCYLMYSFFVMQSAADIKFVAFRFHDILTALLLLNYIIVRQVRLGRVFEVLFMILIIHGFINWLVVTFFFQFFTTVPEIKSYQFLIFYGMDERYLGIHRSQGLFWEPGVYQIYLNIALHYFLFYTKRMFWALLAFVGLLLTLSTTGVIIASVQLAVYVFGMRQSLAKRTVKMLVALPFLVIYVGFAQTVVEDKLTGERSNSYLARSFDTLNGIAIAKEFPLGIGFNPETYQDFARRNAFNIETPLYTDRGQTNGILILVYSTGLLWAAVILFFTFRQKVFPAYPILFFIVLMGSLASEPLFYSPFVWLFTVTGMVRLSPLIQPR